MRLVLPTTGEYPGTWGTQVNTGLTNLVDTAIAGTATITMIAADYTLSTANGAADEARAMTLNLTGTPGAARNVICPAVSKLYIVYNNTTGGFAQTVKTAAGSGISVPNGATAFLRCDGTNVVDAINYFGSLTLGTVTGGTFVSPALTGTPTAPTATAGTNTTQIATTAYVATNFAGLNSPAFTGTPTAPTATAGTSTTQVATTAFVAATAFTSVLPGQTGNAGKYITTDGTNASWADVYPSQTGNSGNFLTTNGTNTSWASTYPLQTGNSGKFISTNGTTVSWTDVYPSQTGNSGNFLTTNGTTTSWASVYPSQTSNAGKFLSTNGTTTSWAFTGIAQVTTATTATTLTSTPTLLQITPASYGVTVTLPDATTCPVGGPLHCIDNRGGYPVRVVNTSGTLLGFVYAGVVSYISLDDKTTAAGVWAISSNELVGASAQLLTTNMIAVNAVVALDSSREMLIGEGSSSWMYAVVYNRATNTFGSPTLVRSVSIAGSTRPVSAVLADTDKVLVTSHPTTALEAVILSVSGTTITVNTAATATLTGVITGANGCGLIAVGSAFSLCYSNSVPQAFARVLTVSGTTVTIGAQTTLNGKEGPLQVAASSTVVLVASYDTAAVNIYFTPYTISGSTLTAGTQATISSSGILSCLTPLGTRWAAVFDNGAGTRRGAVLSLASTTITASAADLFSGAYVDAIVVGSNKLLVLNTSSSNNANILTDTAGTASAGTAITVSASATTRSCLYASGTNVMCASLESPLRLQLVNCSGASPVVTQSYVIFNTDYTTAITSVSNSVLSRSPNRLSGTAFVQTMRTTASTGNYGVRVKNELVSTIANAQLQFVGASASFSTMLNYRGISASEIWIADGQSVIAKWECVA